MCTWPRATGYSCDTIDGGVHARWEPVSDDDDDDDDDAAWSLSCSQ